MSDKKSTPQPIDRKSLVARHNITFTKPQETEFLQVGNGEIAFGVDVTGLQTLGGNTLSQWGWHSTPPPVENPVQTFRMFEVDVHGHTSTYPTDPTGQEELFQWLRENPHRLNLGKFAFLLDGEALEESQLEKIHQELDLWRGRIASEFHVDGKKVSVVTTSHPKLDMLAVQVSSPLLDEGRLGVEVAFPYGKARDRNGATWDSPHLHHTEVEEGQGKALFRRQLDGDRYEASLVWEGAVSFHHGGDHRYELRSDGSGNQLTFFCEFAERISSPYSEGFSSCLRAAEEHWERFWMRGGAIDLSGSKDQRWMELERRIVLSQYLMEVNEAGSLPPQESGLLINSGWFGKFHLEMHWWHGAHYELWGRWDRFERSLGWYRDSLDVARGIAKRQGYRGARWPKMVAADGRFAPSKVGPWLIWQQPHPIFYAEQNYRVEPTRATLEKWKEVVFETATFMASFAQFNPSKGRYELGPMIVNAAENNQDEKAETLNPSFELAYWHYGLQVACQWSERMGLPERQEWREVLSQLSPLPIENGLYPMWEGTSETWTRFNHNHADVIGTGAFLPLGGVDPVVFGHTVEKVLSSWRMDKVWGWDFPWLAMAAAKAGQPKEAVETLLVDDIQNSYDSCGFNRGGPALIYLPGNGGLLYATAMMAAGWDGGPEHHAPGFPDDGSWVVRHEGLSKAQ